MCFRDPERLVSETWMADLMESVCVCGVHGYLQKREREREQERSGGADEGREGKRVSAFINILPKVPHFLGSSLADS